ncbi:HAD-IA family hydrolase [Terrihabitans rhizophilus]|uniref:Phosphoglycolate phosphatase n=1 Tax=Terrihabitans rhizophilus TaxID=3092662 RepID=A0ABU4RP43_9HYPH|nr:HAD-IA family hydrolase [Terrihabitans sp. PJ23]MDX6806616.1 HAD-IA family hydrolase [Terrihabitans sp. PJ23]
MIQPTAVFDLDGTIVDTAPDLVAGLNVALALANLEPVNTHDLRSLVGGGVRVMLTRGLALRGHSVGEERFAELSKAFLAHYELHIADHSTIYPDVAEVLDELSGNGFRVCVCTNKPERLAKLLLSTLQFDNRFEAICGADTFTARKPDPIHLLGTIARAGGDPAKAVMIGDSITDLNAARNASVPCILMDWGYTDIPASELGADTVLSRFSEVPAAIERHLKR